MSILIRVLPEVSEGLAAGRPVVALESSVLAQGLPVPQNREAAELMTAAVRAVGAIPAITAVVRGVPSVGLDPDDLERFLARDGIGKVSARDVSLAIARNEDGATTVAASLMLAHAAGIQVFATGGIGGVHRDVPYDESADLLELSRTPLVVVCAGAKSILDLDATWERLESLGIPVIGYRTDELPGFFTAETGIRLNARADRVDEIVAAWKAERSFGRSQSLVVVQPPPAEHALSRSAVESAVLEAQAEAARDGVKGAAVTPYLLGAVTRLTKGVSLRANLALLARNAALAGEIASKCASSF